MKNKQLKKTQLKRAKRETSWERIQTINRNVPLINQVTLVASHGNATWGPSQDKSKWTGELTLDSDQSAALFGHLLLDYVLVVHGSFERFRELAHGQEKN